MSSSWKLPGVMPTGRLLMVMAVVGWGLIGFRVVSGNCWPKRDKYELDIDQVILTEWGQQCLVVLLRDRPFQRWNKQASGYAFFDEEQVEEGRVPVNSFADVFCALLTEPDLLSLYPINPNPPTGTYWFRSDRRSGRTAEF